eukprot:1461975-Lingulodinium_polyedra.AAC.1
MHADADPRSHACAVRALGRRQPAVLGRQLPRRPGVGHRSAGAPSHGQFGGGRLHHYRHI